MRLLVTGGAGFIGSNFTRWVLANEPLVEKLVVLDLLTYAGNLENIADLRSNKKFSFERGDIRDTELVAKLIKSEGLTHIINFAAESHVDRSIIDPLSFVRTNIEGTQTLLNTARDCAVERYVQISTDEVYGSLGPEGRFTELTPLDPSSTYSASKAGSDLLVLAAHRTHKFPAIVTRCSNNYGPYQFPEKLIPLFITNALNDQPLPLYGDGMNVRSWLHVDDHSRAIALVMKGGKPGEVYNIGGAPEAERTNLNVTYSVLQILDKPKTLIKPVEDRKGHDRRYAVDYSKIKRELGWEPTVRFDQGLIDTVKWYRDNETWWQKVKSGEYQRFYELYYSDRLNKS
jgi:dTDP-glucose 4,6-dehydratase